MDANDNAFEFLSSVILFSVSLILPIFYLKKSNYCHKIRLRMDPAQQVHQNTRQNKAIPRAEKSQKGFSRD